MKKEIWIAILIGFILGLIITYGIYTANRAFKAQTSPSNEPISALNTTPPSLEKQQTISLEITSPENNLLIEQNEATISGKTLPETTVAVMAEDFNRFLTSDNEGLFSIKTPLTAGSNQIKITAIGKNNQQQEKIINLVHSTAEIE